MSVTCPNLTPEQRAAAMPWIIALFATKGLSILSSTVALCYMIFVKNSDYRVGAAWAFASAVLSLFLSRYCFDRLDRVTSIESPLRKRRSWMGDLVWIAALVLMISLIWIKPW